ncbi:hypothetical protein L1987_05705 [Smallanthus sonchifolius]|uniref:Uncharacterized protein n=1 Tax=Smallanthus sonchifolius TaxID=185202 RepID=A0ACB9JWH8_9ASTR|nr:hypothetical protein L1987_05705 [Smallanthus sonchifolius]
MAFSSSSSLPIRSVSLPTRSHPSTLQVEEELVKFKTWETSVSCVSDAETIYSGLTNLGRMYTCVENLLSLPLTRQALSHNQYEKLVLELEDRSMRLLDICGSLRDIVSQIKEHVRDVQSALRRRKGGLIIDASFLKKLTKDAKKGVVDFKQIDHAYGAKPWNIDNHLSSVIRVLRTVSEASVSVFGMILSYLSVLVSKPKSAIKWSIVSKFIQEGEAVCKDQPRMRIEALDCSIEDIENGLECLFRRLIRTQASLLNIISLM